MDTNILESLGRRVRRRHIADFKTSIIRACQQSGVSMASVALANGLNATMVRKWVVKAEGGNCRPASVIATAARSSQLKEFSYIYKTVILMSRVVKVGRRVHIAPRVFVSGDGNFEIGYYACIATNPNIVTSTEIPKDAARCPALW